ncbi:MAG: flagellar assembly peptidoglycan hydrolase FlgJ [Gammaproteobacteria bacterium]|nr:flagellar assembly peptidoglycan hydrolase FlgJ [Gammaproteobacteria bacterium]
MLSPLTDEKELLNMVSRVENPNVYTDLSGLNAISQLGRENTPAALRQVAQQFESLFLNIMLKAMRDSTKSFGEGNFLNSNEMEFHQQNFDNQLSLHLSQSAGLGLADVLYEQMLDQFGLDAPATEPPRGSDPRKPLIGLRIEGEGGRGMRAAEEQSIDSPQEFVRRLYPLAERAAERIGVDPRMLLAQSALETGWGRRMVARPDGASTHNLFGIKADERWSGARASVNTTEYEDGVVRLEKAAFRSYDSFEDSFNDYVDFLEGNPRYREALDNSHDAESFARHLQEAGYATDPVYARKLTRVMHSNTMQMGLRHLEGKR